MAATDRLAAIRRHMSEEGLVRLIAVHDGAHFIETPNPVTVLCGFKSIGPVAAVLDAGRAQLVVTPSWDVTRAAEECPGWEVSGADDVVDGLKLALGRDSSTIATGFAGLPFASWSVTQRIEAALPNARAADTLVFDAANTKTDDEIANARAATRIAEANFARLLEIAKLGVTEDQLAAEIKWHSKSLGADDNFLMLCAGPHNRAVQPSHGRPLQQGDIILAEITPSVRGQLAQICRTAVLGPAGAVLAEKYALVVEAMNAGIAAAKPGVRMADVCGAINTVLEAQGYGEYCHPPYIRRRGHGLGFASNRPGDVALDNDTVLEPGMVFMIHPNQYLPETGYLLCGEPVLLTAHGAEPLTARQAALVELA
jgi:Xaa-Pro aminopeptidase